MKSADEWTNIPDGQLILAPDGWLPSLNKRALADFVHDVQRDALSNDQPRGKHMSNQTIRVGDVVTLRTAEVIKVNRNEIVVRWDCRETRYPFEASLAADACIASVTPCPLRVGDRVIGKDDDRRQSNGTSAEIVAIDDGHAWVRGSGVNWIYKLSDLTRV